MKKVGVNKKTGLLGLLFVSVSVILSVPISFSDIPIYSKMAGIIFVAFIFAITGAVLLLFSFEILELDSMLLFCVIFISGIILDAFGVFLSRTLAFFGSISFLALLIAYILMYICERWENEQLRERFGRYKS